ncbi:MAG: hypothetical protein H0U70_04720 [Tatlockia sp.]|nr:hypothetical protein [Tatlockia sp.]
MTFFNEFRQDINQMTNIFKNKDGKVAGAALYMHNHIKTDPGFFTPYKSLYEFSKSLTKPVTIPLFLGALATLLLIASAVTALAVLPLLIAAGVTHFIDEELRDGLFMISVIAFFATLILPIIASLAVIVAALSPAIFVPKFITQCGATGGQLVKDCISSDTDNSSVQPF